MAEDKAPYLDDLDRAILEAIRDEGRDFKSEILRIVRKEKVLADRTLRSIGPMCR